MAYLVLATALLVAGCVTAYPDGAGDDACSNLMPKHGHSQPSPDFCPFEVIVSKTSYEPNEQLQVTIRQKPDYTTTFKGFLLEARQVGHKEGEEKHHHHHHHSNPIGTFTPVPGTKLKCSGALGHGITHKNPDIKQGLTFVWTAPSTPQGHLEFRATFVAAYDLYWVDQRSPVVSDPSAPETAPSQGNKEKHKYSKELLDSDKLTFERNPEMLPLVRVVRQADSGQSRDPSTDGCGKSDGKGCFRYPPGCQEPACETLVTWKDRGNGLVDFAMSAATEGWVAVGFSDDTRMGADSVIECVYNSAKARMDIRHSYNVDWEKRNEDVGVNGITNTDGYMNKKGASKRLRCMFTRAKIVDNERVFDLSKKYFMIMAMGKVNPKDGKKSMHLLDAGKAPKVSPFRVDLSDTVDINGQARYPLVKAHGCLMVIAWIMSAGLGIIMARYYKPMWPNNRVCGERVWFAVHRVCMILVLICVIAAFIIIFIEAGGYSQMKGLPAAAHPILGIIVTILVIINPLLALCRCHPKHKFRPLFNWVHWLIGTVAFVLQSPTIFIGLGLHKAHVPGWLTWVVVAFLLFHIVIELMLEIHGCINSKKDKERREEWEMRRKNDPSHEQYDKEPNPVGTRFKTIIISLYVVVMLVLGLIIVITIAVS